jgi:hypothetical protein
MKQLRIESHLPAISFELGNKYWIACGANWMEVDRIYTPEELKTIWVKTDRKYDAPVKKRKSAQKVYRVAGSKGSIYRVKQSGDNWTCDCPASSFRRWEECKHIKQIKTQIV